MTPRRRFPDSSAEAPPRGPIFPEIKDATIDAIAGPIWPSPQRLIPRSPAWTRVIPDFHDQVRTDSQMAAADAIMHDDRASLRALASDGVALDRR